MGTTALTRITRAVTRTRTRPNATTRWAVTSTTRGVTVSCLPTTCTSFIPQNLPLSTAVLCTTTSACANASTTQTFSRPAPSKVTLMATRVERQSSTTCTMATTLLTQTTALTEQPDPHTAPSRAIGIT